MFKAFDGGNFFISIQDFVSSFNPVRTGVFGERISLGEVGVFLTGFTPGGTSSKNLQVFSCQTLEHDKNIENKKIGHFENTVLISLPMCNRELICCKGLLRFTVSFISYLKKDGITDLKQILDPKNMEMKYQ